IHSTDSTQRTDELTLETIPALMVRQVNSSVRWVESVEWMKAHGVSRYIECGPGKVLSGLVKRIDKEAICLNILDLESLRSSQAALQGIG
ncbi:MAG TPA: malonyl CoA-acyl carrier protein transacylase, partial [Kiritimatiellia bacterium]|nr:malonyl CoA-acyl carrier protein transacylase [Kiritimatiellia bacterium]